MTVTLSSMTSSRRAKHAGLRHIVAVDVVVVVVVMMTSLLCDGVSGAPKIDDEELTPIYMRVNSTRGGGETSREGEEHLFHEIISIIFVPGGGKFKTGGGWRSGWIMGINIIIAIIFTCYSCNLMRYVITCSYMFHAIFRRFSPLKIG